MDDRQLTLDVAAFDVAGAAFSDCRTYRYALWRRWQSDDSAQQVLFIGLNPSTADESLDDPTIRRCLRFARDWGYGGLLMMNAYGFRATDPRDMKAASDPVGPANDQAFAERGSHVGLVIAAWGAHCSPQREAEVCQVLNRPIYCLGRTKTGRPKHPLYLAADTLPELFWQPSSVGNEDE